MRASEFIIEAEEGLDPQRAKVGKIINRLFGKIYDYGDNGLEYLDRNAPVWYDLFSDDQYNGDIDTIVANAPVELLVTSAQELMDVVSDLPHELSEEEKASWEYDLRNNPWRVTDVDAVSETDFEVALQGPENKQLNYIIRPIDFIETQHQRFQIDSMDVRDLQTGKTFHVPMPGKDEGWWIQIWDAIDTYFWMSPPLQKHLKKIIDYYMEQGAAAGEFAKNPDLMPGLAYRPFHTGIPADRFIKAHQDMKRVTGQQDKKDTE
jgi:hypothetical protein